MASIVHHLTLDCFVDTKHKSIICFTGIDRESETRIAF